ncbi:MAG: VWA domain-containing protein [Kofleriaceae bacterium]
MRRAIFLVALVASCEREQPRPPPPPPTPPAPPALDIMIVLDLSKSMEETDLQTDRLDAAKFGLRQFVAASPHDRIGIVIFAQQAKLLAPLGPDRKALDQTIAKIEIGDVPELGTALGDGLALAVDQVKGAAHKAIVVLGDGENNWVQRYDPQQAAALAKQASVPVYTVLVGQEDTSQLGGMSTDPKELTAIATTTGGTFTRAPSREALAQDLAAIRATLDRPR